MKILLIRTGETSPYEKIMSKVPLHYPSKVYFQHKSLTLPILAALTPNKHELTVVEGGPNNVDFNENYDLVAISSITRYALLGYAIADEFRKRGVAVVLGGYHHSALPEEAKQHADSVVIGEAEETWPMLLNDFEKGNLKPFYQPKRGVDLKLIPHPKLDVFPKGTGVGIQATRGCPYGCDFCSITHMKNRNIFRKRSIDLVIEEIKSIPNKSFFLFDNSVTIDPKYMKELFREMKGLNKKFIAYANIDVLGKDEEFLKLASEAGCTIWMIGFESISQKTLDHIGKKTNKAKEYISAIKKIHEYNMLIFGLFAFGFDTDTLDIFDETNNFVKKSGIDLPYFHMLSPEPGTPIFKKLDLEGRIFTKDWSKYSTADHVVFQPKNMTPEQLLNNTLRIRKDQYSLSNIFRRILNTRKLGYYAFFENSWSNFHLKALTNMYSPKRHN